MIAKNNSKPTETKAGTTTPLLEKKPASIKTITYLRDNVPQVKFEKDGDNWTMLEPAKAPVDTYTVGNIASSLLNMSYVRKFEPEATGDRSPESTGTAKTRNTIKFTDNTGKEYTLAIGYKTNEGGVFALFNGEKTIYALESNPVPQLAKDPDDFRKKQINQVEESKIVKLEVKSSKVVDGKAVTSDIKLEKTDGKWMITEPVAARANAPVIQEIVKAVSNVNALSFSSLKKKEAGVDPGVASVTAWYEEPVAATASAPATTSAPATATASASATATSKPATKLAQVTLQLGLATSALNRDTSPVYAGMAGRDEVFTLSRDTFTNVNKELKDVRDPAVLPTTIRKATEFTLTTDNKVTVAASSKDGVWSLANGSTPLAGDGMAIGNFLGVVEDLRAIKFVDAAGDLKSLGLEPPHMKIDLTIPGQTQHEVLLVGKSEAGVEGGKITPVMRQGEKTVYQVQTSDAAKLATTLVALRDRDVDRVDADRIRKIEISGPLATAGAAASQPATGPATATTTAPTTLKPGVVLEREGTHWVVKKDGESKTADDMKISALLADFTPLQASKYVDDKVAEGTPNVVVTLTLLAPTATPPASATSTAPATTASAPATASATKAAEPALPIVAPTGAMGPDVGKTITYTLRLYRQEGAAAASAPATAPASGPANTWKAAWDKQTPAWTFEPTRALIDHVTKDVYTALPNAGSMTTPVPLPEDQ
jgi:hypothetical protein